MARIIEQAKPRKLTKQDYQRMNLPPKYWDAKSSLIHKSAKGSVLRYLKARTKMMNLGVGLLLFGGKSSGKSSIAAGTLKTVVAWGYTGYWTDLLELREAVKNYHRYDDDQSIMQRCMRVHFLVVDDVSPKNIWDRGFGDSQLLSLLRHRHSYQLPTVVTTPARFNEESLPDNADRVRFLKDFDGWALVSVEGTFDTSDVMSEIYGGEK